MSNTPAAPSVLAALALGLAACTSDPGLSCRNVGHTPGTKGYADCEAQAAEGRAKGTRAIANQIPLDGYGPRMGRF